MKRFLIATALALGLTMVGNYQASSQVVNPQSGCGFGCAHFMCLYAYGVTCDTPMPFMFSVGQGQIAFGGAPDGICRSYTNPIPPFPDTFMVFKTFVASVSPNCTPNAPCGGLCNTIASTPGVALTMPAPVMVQHMTCVLPDLPPEG